MSNKSRLQTNNTNLQALIDKANTLPDAGSVSGGGSIETSQVMCVNVDARFAAFTQLNTLTNELEPTYMEGTLGDHLFGAILRQGTFVLFFGYSNQDVLQFLSVYGADFTSRYVEGGTLVYLFNLTEDVQIIWGGAGGGAGN